MILQNLLPAAGLWNDCDKHCYFQHGSASERAHTHTHTTDRDVSLHVHMHARKTPQRWGPVRELWLTSAGYKQRGSAPSRDRLSWNKRCNRITRCLNRPVRDALSFPAGKADQSQPSSPSWVGEREFVGGQRVKGEMSEEMTGYSHITGVHV